MRRIDTTWLVVGEGKVQQAVEEAVTRAEKRTAKEPDVKPGDIDAAIQQANQALAANAELISALAALWTIWTCDCQALIPLLAFKLVRPLTAFWRLVRSVQ